MVASSEHLPAGPGGAPRRPMLPVRAPGWLSRLFQGNRRAAPRLFELRGFARVEGVLVRVGDLSRGGMRLTGYRGLLDRQDRFAFSLSIVCDGEGADGGDLTLEIRGEALVAWRSRDRLGAAFYAMEDLDRARLERALALVADRLEA